jgi:hypothetical protein
MAGAGLQPTPAAPSSSRLRFQPAFRSREGMTPCTVVPFRVHVAAMDGREAVVATGIRLEAMAVVAQVGGRLLQGVTQTLEVHLGGCAREVTARALQGVYLRRHLVVEQLVFVGLHGGVRRSRGKSHVHQTGLDGRVVIPGREVVLRREHDQLIATREV